jgi:Ca2+-binding RTX toxin-like protein
VIGGAGAAGAKTVSGTDGPDRLQGTAAADILDGRSGDDRIEARGGDDFVNGGRGADTIFAGAGNDRISVEQDRSRDVVHCGAGRDVVTAERSDTVTADCEVVSRQLSRDPYLNPDSQHETQVEPDSFSFGSTVVATFQSGRFPDGGASNIGFATSRNNGRTWRSGFLPGMSAFSVPPGDNELVSDPAVAYDAAHKSWLVASLSEAGSGSELLVTRSSNGINWRRPVTAASNDGEDFDKEWIVCDNGRASPFRGRCYITFTDFAGHRVGTIASSDAGVTWSKPTTFYAWTAPFEYANGTQPVVQTDGTLVVAFVIFQRTSANVVTVRSLDGGATFETPVLVSALFDADVVGMRAPSFPSAGVDAQGTIYLAWHDRRFSADDWTSGIALTSSRDGVTWTEPTRVPTGRLNIGRQDFLPGLAVDPATSGRKARLAITYYTLPEQGGCELYFVCPGVDAELVTSRDGGVTWAPPQRLTTRPMTLGWIADTGLGRMLGDYISTSFAGGRVVPVFAVASPKVGGSFRQAIYAMTRLVGTPPPLRR